MKKILILGGYSNKNIEFINGWKEQLSDYNVTLQQYNHWKGQEFSLETESSKFLELIKDQDILIAKSIGTIITLTNIKELNIKKIILMGIPQRLCKEENIDIKNLIKSNQINTLYIHQEHDVTGIYQELSMIVPNAVCISGSDHSYTNYDEILPIIKPFIER